MIRVGRAEIRHCGNISPSMLRSMGSFTSGRSALDALGSLNRLNSRLVELAWFSLLR